MRLIDADATIKTLEELTELCRGEGAVLVKALVFAALKSQSLIPTVSGWVSVKDRIPKRKGVYLVYAPDYKPGSSRGQPNHNGIMFSYWNGTAWWIEIQGGYRYRKSFVRYWMPLPEPPEVREDCEEDDEC